MPNDDELKRLIDRFDPVEIQRAMISEYGATEVRSALKRASPPKRKKGSAGAPKTPLLQDAIIYALHLMLSDRWKHISQRSHYIVKFLKPRIRDQFSGGGTTWKNINSETIRRPYRKLQTRYATNWEFSDAVSHMIWILIWWRSRAVNLMQEIGIETAGGTTLHLSPKNPAPLVEEIDRYVEIREYVDTSNFPPLSHNSIMTFREAEGDNRIETAISISWEKTPPVGIFAYTPMVLSQNQSTLTRYQGVHRVYRTTPE